MKKGITLAISIFQILHDKQAAELVVRLIDSKYRGTILRILVQFSSSAIVVDAMCAFDGVTKLTNIITNEKASKNDLNNSILILSMLTSQSCNRLKVRQSGSFKKLIQTAMESADEEEIKMVCD